MIAKLRSHFTSAHALGLAALVFAIGGYAVASIPGKDGVITACYQKKSGKLRVVDESKKKQCTKSERKLIWNQQGRQGLQGLQGAPGQDGAPGQNGQDAVHLWAVVDGANGANPALVKGKGAVSAVRNNQGTYFITFNQDVTNCALTPAFAHKQPVLPGVTLPIPAIKAAWKLSEPNAVVVATYAESGGSVTTIDAEFHLVVTC